MRILRSADHKRMPWKNGKGETVEIAVWPPGATVENFDWRISMATVAEDGPFSVFEGIDRTLSLLSGEGMTLSVAGQDPVILDRETPPYSFPADTPTDATLLSGPITDLNVMTRRGAFIHRVDRIVTRELRLSPSSDLRILLTLSELQDGRGQFVLEPFDALLLDGHEQVTLTSSQPVTIFVVEIDALKA
jgi:environmental stress-induced protein Ves